MQKETPAEPVSEPALLTNEAGTMSSKVITVPMSARIDHLNMETQMVEIQFAHSVTQYAQLALVPKTDSAQLVSMAITWMAKRVRNAMLIVPHALEVYRPNVVDVQRDTFWMWLLIVQKHDRILAGHVGSCAIRIRLGGIMSSQGITVPMSARIDHHSLVITGQMLTNRNACFATLIARNVLDTTMDNVRDVLMDTTYQEQLVRSVMVIVLLAMAELHHNAADVLTVTSWMWPQIRLGEQLKTLDELVF